MEKIIKERIADWHKRIKLLGLTRKAFCKIADVNYDTYKKVKNPTYVTLQKIEAKLNELENNGK